MTGADRDVSPGVRDDVLEPALARKEAIDLRSLARLGDVAELAGLALALAKAGEEASLAGELAQLRGHPFLDRLGRVDPLTKEGTLPPAQLDQAQAEARMRDAELASALFSRQVAAHDIEQARAALERFSASARPSEQFDVTSPVHGQVLHVLHKSEGVVAAGQALLEIGDPQALELVVDVLSEDSVAVHPGMPARLLHWGGAPPLEAKVRRVEPSAFTKTSSG